MTGADAATLLPMLRASERALQVDALYYLLAELDPGERANFAAALARDAPDLLDRFRQAEALAPPSDRTEVGRDELRTYLSSLAVEPRRAGGAQTAGVGRRYWRSLARRLADALCTDSPRYQADRARLRQSGRTSVTVAVPVLVSWLALPPELAGFAIIASVFMVRVGVDAFCDVLTEELARTSRPRRTRQRP